MLEYKTFSGVVIMAISNTFNCEEIIEQFPFETFTVSKEELKPLYIENLPDKFKNILSGSYLPELIRYILNTKSIIIVENSDNESFTFSTDNGDKYIVKFNVSTTNFVKLSITKDGVSKIWKYNIQDNGQIEISPLSYEFENAKNKVTRLYQGRIAVIDLCDEKYCLSIKIKSNDENENNLAIPFEAQFIDAALKLLIRIPFLDVKNVVILIKKVTGINLGNYSITVKTNDINSIDNPYGKINILSGDVRCYTKTDKDDSNNLVTRSVTKTSGNKLVYKINNTPITSYEEEIYFPKPRFDIDEINTFIRLLMKNRLYRK